jgi:ketosteroid isomerase-like protein
MGKIEDLVMRNNAAFSRGDAEGALAGWHRDGVLTPLPGGRSYRGRDEIMAFFTKDIYEIPEFDFRIYSVLEQRELAIVFGRYSVSERGVIIDKGIFWILEVHDEEVVVFEAFANVGEAFAVFQERLQSR